MRADLRGPQAGSVIVAQGRTTPRGRRVDELLQRVIAETLNGLADPRLRPITVTGVRASRDTAVADVYVQISGAVARRGKVFDGLEAARAVLQSRIGAEMRLKRTPLLRFHYDGSYEQGTRIEEILREHPLQAPEADDSTADPADSA